MYEQRAEELLVEYRKRRAKARELVQKIAEVSESATAPRRTVKVTVNGNGDVRAVEFLTAAYKRMPPAELADLLVSTINEAKEAALASVADLMTTEHPARERFLALLSGGRDSLAAPGEKDIPEVVRDFLGHGQVPTEE